VVAYTSFFSAVVRFFGLDSSASEAPHKPIVFLLYRVCLSIYTI
jgi:hypothetical protein